MDVCAQSVKREIDMPSISQHRAIDGQAPKVEEPIDMAVDELPPGRSAILGMVEEPAAIRRRYPSAG